MPFIAGPAVRVSPNSTIEIRWSADFIGDGRVDIFDNANGGTPVDVKTTPLKNMEHTVVFTIGGLLKADTNYFFRITHSDPGGLRGDLTNDPAPFPPIFSGVQAIGDVFAEPEVDRAVISWTANVIGFGRVEYGIASPGDIGTMQDPYNIPDHSIELTGLSPGTTYQFRVSNRHAIDQGSLAEKTGSFTTKPGVSSSFTLTEPLARPRVIRQGEYALLSVVVRKQGSPLPNVPVRFAVLNGTASAEAISDTDGKASTWMKGVAEGLLQVQASSPNAVNRPVIPVVVRRS